jgi:RNA polymerase sigma-70 factor (ECF subfamily)
MEREKRHFDVIGQLSALRRYARSLVRNPAEAEDLVHDALLRAYEKRFTFRVGSNLRAWLMSILHNTHVDRSRSARSRLGREDAVRDAAELAAPAAQEDVVRLAQIRRAFMELPEDQREALHLVAIEELSYQEAAEALGIPVGTLMSRISRARARLRAIEDGSREPGRLRIVGGTDE